MGDHLALPCMVHAIPSVEETGRAYDESLIEVTGYCQRVQDDSLSETYSLRKPFP